MLGNPKSPTSDMFVVQGPPQRTGSGDWESRKSLEPEGREFPTSAGPGDQGSIGVPSPSKPPPKPAIPEGSSLHAAPPSVQPSAPPRLPPRPPYTEAAPWMWAGDRGTRGTPVPEVLQKCTPGPGFREADSAPARRMPGIVVPAGRALWGGPKAREACWGC